MSFSPLRFTRAEFVSAIVQQLGRGQEHARLLYKEWFCRGEMSGKSPAFARAARLLAAIRELTDRRVPALAATHSEGETTKFLLSLADGLETESVLIPMASGWTLCLSSQIGCRMGCAFCETGRLGLVRHLYAEEIVAQAWAARHYLKVPVRNVVFMGMGEPLDNYEEVMRAVAVLTDPDGFGLFARNITLSTSGRVEQIYRLIEEASPSLNLAVSINAPNDAIRKKLMPINRQYDMAALHAAMVAYCAHPRREIFIEYVLIAGVNDSKEHADELACYLRGIRRGQVRRFL
jgi:23S rRNA (adenine2503-C2)-methyltransferase